MVTVSLMVLLYKSVLYKCVGHECRRPQVYASA
jgi:hypothetical protein